MLIIEFRSSAFLLFLLSSTNLLLSWNCVPIFSASLPRGVHDSVLSQCTLFPLVSPVRICDPCMRAKSLQSCLTPCSPMDHSLPGSSLHGILQARILEWVAIPFSRDLPNPGIEAMSLASLALAGRFFTTVPPGKPTMEYQSAVKKNGMLPFAATWMQLEIIILSKVSQTEKDKYRMTSLISGI